MPGKPMTGWTKRLVYAGFGVSLLINIIFRPGGEWGLLGSMLAGAGIAVVFVLVGGLVGGVIDKRG